jgi:hypothetical protein
VNSVSFSSQLDQILFIGPGDKEKLRVYLFFKNFGFNPLTMECPWDVVVFYIANGREGFGIAYFDLFFFNEFR